MVKERMIQARHYALVTFGALALSVLTFGHAGAMTADQCAAQSGLPAFYSVAIQQGSIMILWPDGNVFAANDSLQVYCRASNGGANLGAVDNAKVRLRLVPQGSIPASAFTIVAIGAPTVGSNPAEMGPFSGRLDYRVTADSSVMAAGATSALVATDTTLVIEGWGGPLTDPGGSNLSLGTFGSVVARTPEIGSLVLFGAGAAGMAGYAVTRFRARRRDLGAR